MDYWDIQRARRQKFIDAMQGAEWNEEQLRQMREAQKPMGQEIKYMHLDEQTKMNEQSFKKYIANMKKFWLKQGVHYASFSQFDREAMEANHFLHLKKQALMAQENRCDHYDDAMKYAMITMKKRKPKITDTRRFKLEDDDFIPFMGGRPKRDNPINKDDVVNLVIAMHKCRTLSDFFERV